MNNLECEDRLAGFEQLPASLVYQIDPNEIRLSQVLPFGSLDRHEVRKLLYLPVELGSRDFERRQRACRSIPKGPLLSLNLSPNYVLLIVLVLLNGCRKLHCQRHSG